MSFGRPYRYLFVLSVLFLIVGTSSDLSAKTTRPIIRPVPTISAGSKNPVPKQQLLDAGASCTGETCTYHGALWDCTNPQSCTPVPHGGG